MSQSSPSLRPSSPDLIQHLVVSYLNGQGAYRDGTLPCNHVTVYEYPDCIRTLHTKDRDSQHVWTVYPRFGDNGFPNGNTFESICSLVERYGA